MDNLSQSIITLDVHFADKAERLRHAWDIVHAKLVEGQKPTTNSAMVPCPACSNEGPHMVVYKKLYQCSCAACFDDEQAQHQ